jgi:hypothetical protein
MISNPIGFLLLLPEIKGVIFFTFLIWTRLKVTHSIPTLYRGEARSQDREFDKNYSGIGSG